MAICEKCGVEFDEDEVGFEFQMSVDSAFPVSYDEFGRSLCVDCAVEEFESGNYFDTCECCGKRFNPQDDESEFLRQVSDRFVDADMFTFGLLCADCAANKLYEADEEWKKFMD